MSDMNPIEKKIDTVERLARLPITIIIVLLLWWTLSNQADRLDEHLNRVDRTLDRLTIAVERLAD